MKKLYSVVMMALVGMSAHAQYLTEAPSGGFNVNGGKDYIVFYAPQDIVTKMGSKIQSNQNLDPTGKKTTCDYWGTNPDLSVCDVDAGLKNSWGGDECFNITSTGYWGATATGLACFRNVTGTYDLSMLDDDYILHIGILNNSGSSLATTGIVFWIGDQDSNNSIKLYCGPKARQSGYVKAGAFTNDSKWYYLEMPVSTIKTNFKSFDPATTVTSANFFRFGFVAGTSSTVTTDLEPGAEVYTYTVTAVKSAMGMDSFFFYKPDTSSGITGVQADEAEGVKGVYDLSGRQTNMDKAGLYIVKDGKSAKKVIVK